MWANKNLFGGQREVIMTRGFLLGISVFICFSFTLFSRDYSALIVSTVSKRPKIVLASASIVSLAVIAALLIRQTRKEEIESEEPPPDLPIDIETFIDADMPLHAAIYADSYEALNYLVKNGADVNDVDFNLCSPLHLACRVGNEKMVVCLVKYGARMDKADIRGNLPLHIACRYCNKETIDFLISKGADINAAGSHKDSPLHVACKERDVDIVDLLVNKGAVVNIKNSLGASPLYFACSKEGGEGLANYLLGRGAYVNDMTIPRITPLGIALLGGRLNIVELLLKRGADIQRGSIGMRANVVGKYIGGPKLDRICELSKKVKGNTEAIIEFKRQVERSMESDDRYSFCVSYECCKKINKIMRSADTPAYDKQHFIEFLLKNHRGCLSTNNIAQFFLEIPFNEEFFKLQRVVEFALSENLVDVDGDDVLHKTAVFNLPEAFIKIFSFNGKLYGVDQLSKKILLQNSKAKNLNEHTFALVEALEMAKKRKLKKYFRDVVNSIFVSDYLNRFLSEGDHSCCETNARGIVAKIMAFTGGDFGKKFGLSTCKSKQINECAIH